MTSGETSTFRFEGASTGIVLVDEAGFAPVTTSVKRGVRGGGTGGSRTVPKNLSVAGAGSLAAGLGGCGAAAGEVLAVAVLAAGVTGASGCGVAGASVVRSGESGGGRGVNLLSRLKFNLSCCLQADVAHGAEDSFGSRPVRAEIRQLGFEGIAEVDGGLRFLVVCKLRVDQGE